jgi:hypothetical protein
VIIFNPMKNPRNPRVSLLVSPSSGPALRFSWSLIPRSIALFIILYQFRLLAADLADTAVFVLTLLGAFAAALFLVRRAKPGEALLIILLIPWTLRFLIALPRFFAGGTALVLDSLLLNLDRNNFVLLGPFYWAALTTYFSGRSRVFLRADIIAADTLFLVLFSIAPSSGMEAYRWPILMIALFGGVFYLQVLALILSIPPELGLRRREGLLAALSFLLLAIIGGALLIRPSQEKATERGGGLLEPRLFHFDFSQVLRLDSEISLNDDLVLILKKEGAEDHIFMRRYTLSGFNPKQGFFRTEGPDEEAHPQRLPDRPSALKTRPIKEYRETSQEYYLVNFDASAFIGMNMPVEVLPFKTWDASSFKSAYGVLSHTSGAAPFDLMDAVKGTPGYGDISPEDLGLDAGEYGLYTEYGGDRELAEYAEQICWGVRGYWDRIEAVFDHLKNGDYRYSLKPGIAPDGDQLKYFLFETKKGYCSYYAFAFALLLRSLGVPCRVAAGFFMDPSTGAFDYYPVRADMAHAWVEVWYPGYGWIDYDPTTDRLAEGEEFRFSPGTPPELFERLLKEILDNRHRLTPREGAEEDRRGLNLAALGTEALRLLRKGGLPLGVLLLALVFAWMRAGRAAASVLARGERKKAGLLWSHALRRLALGGYPRRGNAEADWVKDREGLFPGLYDLYQGVSAARFAERYGDEDWGSYKNSYRRFDEVYRRAVPLKRRALAWVLPPLALLLGPWAQGNAAAGGGGGAGRRGKTGMVLLLAFLLLGRDGGAQNGVSPADRLLEEAQGAQEAEFWERAVELYTRGKEAYPQDSRFPWALGNLYYYRRLYRLAWDEFRAAEKLIPLDPDLLYLLSRTAGYLNEDQSSAEYLERLLVIEPDNKAAIGNLAWMYYKIHRLGEGLRLLGSAMERLGSDADFAMTMGTLYSDLFRYDEGKRWYLEAIKGAEAIGDRHFAAVANYNLSILESRFYRFNQALESTNRSLESLDRAPGRLARGELYLRRMEVNRGIGEYQAAYEMDTSPLSKVNLAQAFQMGGRLEEARLYAEDCLKPGDLSWMLNYGIDPVRYKRDLHEILRDTYQGLGRAEKFRASFTLKERVRSFFRIITCRFKGALHETLYRKYSLMAGNAYGVDRFSDGSPHLNALLQYYNAFEGYPRRALTYLLKAREFEESLIPESGPSYDYEAGKLLKKRSFLIRALERFDPQWERDMLAETYQELALPAKRKFDQEAYRDAAERLFAINRGALPQGGIRLPAAVRIEGAPRRIERMLYRGIRAAGIEPVKNGTVPPRYTLRISLDEEWRVRFELYDGGRGVSVFRRTLPLGFSAPERETLFRALSEGVFRE